MNEKNGSADAPISDPNGAMPASASGIPRLSGLDFTRGIAVLGILAANIIAFGQPWHAYIWPDAFLTPHDEAADWMWVIQFLLIDGKMRGLFTLLFGAGLVLFMEKAWAKGETRMLQARRLLFLLMFGAIHYYLIWRGDILMLYAMIGFIAMFCVRWAVKTQLIVGLLGYLVGAILLTTGLGFQHAVAETSFGDQNTMAESREEFAAYKNDLLADDAIEAAIQKNGTYTEFVSHAINEHGAEPFWNVLSLVFETLPLMLIGMALFRLGLFSGGFDPASQRKWAWIGIIAGTLVTLPIALWIKTTGFPFWGSMAAFVGYSALPRLPVILGFAALFALWGPAATGWLGQRLTAAGRMAFSNYLGTSMLMALIFYGWLGGLYGQLGRPQLYLVVLAAWAVMLLWSKPWLERFRFGPLEWLWRCLTYGKLFPLRR